MEEVTTATLPLSPCEERRSYIGVVRWRSLRLRVRRGGATSVSCGGVPLRRRARGAPFGSDAIKETKAMAGLQRLAEPTRDVQTGLLSARSVLQVLFSEHGELKCLDELGASFCGGGIRSALDLNSGSGRCPYKPEALVQYQGDAPPARGHRRRFSERMVFRSGDADGASAEAVGWRCGLQRGARGGACRPRGGPSSRPSPAAGSGRWRGSTLTSTTTRFVVSNGLRWEDNRTLIFTAKRSTVFAPSTPSPEPRRPISWLPHRDGQPL
ncbi:uncharacterized protein LOC119325777 [Triticum dicoccoides]|uniref:uncharacterized protein LOC119325777 n=1 Tax=Triticum dicoccoides TaxID=85692 RepID=UPI00189181F5|nr:uncharacterized protein LOC119325777 [Triticum dicoccoides]